MAFFTTEDQTSQYYKDPTPYRGSKFVLGLMGYKADGTKSTFGKITDAALPIIGGVGGALIGGPAGAAIGAKIGSFAGQGLDFLGNKAAEDMTRNTDAQANVEADLPGTLARGQLGAGLGELATGTMAGMSGDNKGDFLGALTKSFTGAAPAIGTGLAGTLATNTTLPMPYNKNSQRIRYFAGGGDTPLPARDAFRSGQSFRRYRMNNAVQDRVSNGIFEMMNGNVGAPVPNDVPSGVVVPPVIDRYGVTGSQAYRNYRNSSQVDHRVTNDLMDLKYGSGPAPVMDPPATGSEPVTPIDTPDSLPMRNAFMTNRVSRGYRMGNQVSDRINDGLFDQIYGTAPAPVQSTGSTTAAPTMLPEVSVTAARDSRFVGDRMEPLAGGGGFHQMSQRYRDYRMANPLLNRVDEEMFSRQMDDKYAPVPRRGTAVGRWLRNHFKEGGETIMTYKSGGLTYVLSQPSDYKVYDDNDNTEDLHITLPDGTPYGKMRLGERIFDQKSNLTMKAVMTSDAPASEKKKALGTHIFDELLTHKNAEGQREFAGGGETGPGKSLNDAFNQAVAARTPTFMHNGKLHRVIDLDPMAGAWATPKPTAAAPQTEMQRYQNSQFHQNQQTGQAATPMATAPAPAAAAATTPMPTGRPGRPQAAHPYRPGRTATTTVAPAAAVTTAAPAGTHLVQAGDTLDAIANRYNTNRADLMLNNDLKDPNKIQVGQVLNLSDPRTSIKTPALATGTATNDRAEAIMSPVDPNAARVAGLNANIAAAPDNDISPAATTDSTTGNLGNSLLNFGRIAAGAALASKQVPTYSLPDSYVKWRGEVEAKKNQGLSPAEWAAANGNITSNYSAGVNAQSSMLGGGASPGAVLAGLTRLNQVSGQQRLAVAQTDTARRAQNFSAYGASVNNGIGLDRQIYEDQAGRAAATQGVGVGLIQGGLQDMQQSRMVNEQYGPSSIYSRLLNLSANKEQSAIDLQEAQRRSVLKKAGIQ